MKPVIYMASANAHKIGEFSAMFKADGFDCELRGIRDVSGYVPPEENGKTFEENAFIKADALRALAPASAYVMADDSGIVVDALGGAPGIRSARYAGAEGADADNLNNKKLLKNLGGVEDSKRTARFVCVIALITPSGERRSFTGLFEGVINRGECGRNGFGYDPLFYLPERGCTSAELAPEVKNEISHRGTAFKKLSKFLKEQKA